MARILLADDEDSVRKVIARGLELDGHVIVAAEDGGVALTALRCDQPIDLLLADIAMPVMDGIALALVVARDWPDIPVLLMSGYIDQRRRAAGLDVLVKNVLAKPLGIGDVREAVRMALRH